MTQQGILIRSTGSWYEVLTPQGEVLQCRIRGRIRLKGARSTNPVVVGDGVVCEESEEGEWMICDILPRRNYIIRRSSNLSKESHIIAANIDRAMIAVTLFSPSTANEFVDRFLVTCQAYKVPVTILLLKMDIMCQRPQEVELFERIYRSAGYDVRELSVITGQGIEELREELRGQTTLIAGNSGVGKSTLISAVEPSIETRTGEISQSHHKGKHTTTFSTMYPLTGGGFIIDTPGIKGFGLIDIDERELWHYFPEMLRVGSQCRFYNCTHTHEPHCAVVEAVEKGEIAESRYESYLKILDEDDKYRK